MITSTDREYKATKRIKQGVKELTGPFAELARWISSKWRVTVLNVIYDKRNSLHAPRVQVILEHESDRKKFHRGMGFDPEKQLQIKEKFLEIIGREDPSEYDVNGLFVVFSAFAPIAREEASSKITEEEVKALKARIGNPDLWEISRCFTLVTFFFYTDAQVKRYAARGKKALYAKMYFKLLKPHDEFGYLDEKEFTVQFDSKENFDKNYESSWFYYYR